MWIWNDDVVKSQQIRQCIGKITVLQIAVPDILDGSASERNQQLYRRCDGIAITVTT
jgi:hypothetical protein